MKPIIINIHNLVENLSVTDSVQGRQELEDSITETLHKVIQNAQLEDEHTTNNQSKIESTSSGNINTAECYVSLKIKHLNALLDELNRLRYHEDTTIGLYAIDRNPKKVKYKWIKKHAFRIKKTCNVL